MPIKSQQEIYDDFINELQAQAPQLTDVTEGSINDVLAGVVSTIVSEVNQVVLEQFLKTFIDTANGPEVTGGPDDLERLAVDHFGEEFRRPPASKATGTVLFSRPNTDAGNVTILAGTVVKTTANAAGTSVRFETTSTVTMTGLSISASVRAIVAGVEGNVNSSTVNQIESTLTDPTVTVNNAAGFAGGGAAETDAEYRETIRRLIQRIRGATKEAIEAAALTVDGVETAVAVETEKPVIEYDIGNDSILSGAEFFRIPFVDLYIADANGTASNALIADVKAAIEDVRAYGVYILVSGASAVNLNWTAAITLNISGPNYPLFSSDTTQIQEAMAQYINELDIGADFIVANAEAAIMAIYGPSGTGDLTAFTTSVPVGDVSTAVNEKLIAGTMTIS